MLALATLVAGLNLGEPKAVVTLKYAAAGFTFLWVLWVTGTLLSLNNAQSRNSDVATTQLIQSASSQDRHAGWTGHHNYNNQYFIRVADADCHVFIDCLFWTPPNCWGRVFLDDQRGTRTEILRWDENSTPNRRLPDGVGNGNGGVNRVSEALILAAPIAPIRIDISQYVQRDSTYRVDFEYRSGDNGTWTQGVLLTSSP